MKKIALLGFYKPKINGPSIHLQALAKHIKKDCDVVVISVQDVNLSIPKKWRDDGIEVHSIPLSLVNRFTIIQTFLKSTIKSFSLRNDIDIYHSHGIFFSGICFLDRRKPFLLTIHGYSSQETISHDRINSNSMLFKFMRFIEKQTINRADVVIVVSSKLKDWVISELNADEKKVFVIPNGVDPEKFRPFDASSLREKLGYSTNDKIIMFVKAFTKQSGIEYLIKSIPHIYKRFPDTKLLAIGGGPLHEELIEEIKRLGLKSQIKLMNSIPNEEVPYYLNMSDIFVFPSVPMSGTEETFGISLIEAMACGKPVVSTEIGGPKEILEGSKDVGILIPPKSPEDISNAVIKLLENSDYAKKIGDNARNYIISKYTWNEVFKKTTNLYQYAYNSYSMKNK
mgnify:CR=1 FL=1